MERCERSDLYPDQCAHCRGHVAVEDEIRQARAALLAKPNWFPAQYAGNCGSCGEGFPAGAALRSPLPGRLGWVAECCSN